ncbi:MAG TPA: serine/threonine-protein kinase [Polyangiales bacterium]
MSRTPIRASAPLPFEGRMFGGYRIAHPIATGGMATVFLARKTGPGRFAQTAAIKIIHPHLARNRELSEMFMDEARLASCINHPNVCRVFDFGEAEGTFFLAMEYVRGESWSGVLPALLAADATRVAALAAHVLAQACEGLHAIHEALGPDGRPLNIVHRDVSPQNLLIAYDGSVRLLDFGIASAEGRAHTGSTEVVRGRYAYMAPEQMRGMEIDRRADVWSLGVMLYEALHGYNPFIRDTQIATMLAVTQEPLPEWSGHTPPELQEIGRRALAREPEARFSNARELGDALARFLARSGESALHAELSRQLRHTFAEQIAQKRAALRELSGEDTSVELSSVFPPVQAAETPLEPLAPAPAITRSSRRPTRSVLAAGLGLFALSSAASWYAVRQVDPPPSLATRAAPARQPTPGAAEQAAAAPAESGRASAPAPTATTTPEPAARSGAEQHDDASESRRERRQRRRREREEAEQVAAPAGPAAPEAAPTRPPISTKSGPGTLVIGTSQGWALIFEGSRKLGTTPLKLELSSGPHVLEVRPYGEGAARRVPIEVKPGEVTKLRVEL